MKLPYVQVVDVQGKPINRNHVTPPVGFDLDYCCDELREANSDMFIIYEGKVEIRDNGEDGTGYDVNYCPFCGQNFVPVEVQRILRTWTTKKVKCNREETSHKDKEIPVPKSTG